VRKYSAFAALLLSIAAMATDRSAGPPVLLKTEDLAVAIEPEALQKQFEALSAMPSVLVEYSSRGTVRSIRGDTGVVLPDSVRLLTEGASAAVVLDAFRAVLLATGSETLTVTRNALGQIRADQSIRDIPVVHGRTATDAFQSLKYVIAEVDAKAIRGSGINTNVPRAEFFELRARWRNFLQTHREDLITGKRFSYLDPVIRPLMVTANGERIFNLSLPDGTMWPE
jgi:hypothetical protein